MNFKGVPVIGFCAWSGTGKTTLITQLIPLLKQQGLRLAVLKHAHHQACLDTPSKDTYRYRAQGAEQIVLASRNGIASIQSRILDEEPSLEEALAALDTAQLDLILVEGFKYAPYPKIELTRPSLGRPLLFPNDPNVIAVASDQPITHTHAPAQQLDLNQPTDIANFILNKVLSPSYQESA